MTMRKDFRGKKTKTKTVKSPKPEVNPEHVARLAYELYIRRGGEHGRDQEDWLTAERILVQEYQQKNDRRRASDERRRLEDKLRSK